MNEQDISQAAKGEKAVVVFSGGQDSTTCLYWAVQRGYEVLALTINYGQRHQREIKAATKIAAMLKMNNVQHEVLDIGSILKGSSPLVSSNHLEQYADFKSLPGGLEKTFVPMRNQLFLTIAANRAHVFGAQYLITGVCEEDYGGYPDCRASFIDKLQDACCEGTFTDRPFGILTPLMNLTKKQTVEMALEIPGCYAALAHSHTAYDGKYPPLGQDHATLLRAKGFFEAVVPDPLVLRAVKEGVMELPETENYSQDLKVYYELAGL